MNRTCYCPESGHVAKVCAWREHLRPYQSKSKVTFDPNHVALLILDMQQYFLNQDSHAFAPQAPLLLRSLVELQQLFLSSGRPVIQTRHQDDSPTSPMVAWWRRRVLLPEEGGGIHPALRDGRVHVITKGAYSAFFETALKKTLQSRGIRQIVVGGVLTHLCCETTIRDAFMQGFEVFMLIDGMATYTEELHVGSLSALTHGFATPLTCSELLHHMNLNRLAVGRGL